MSFPPSTDALLSLLFPSCAKLNKVAQGKGNATHDQVCVDRLPSSLTPDTSSIRTSNETNDSDVLKLPANLVTLANVLSSATTKIPSSTPKEKAGTSPTSDKGETTTRGQKGFILSIIDFYSIKGHVLFRYIFSESSTWASCLTPTICEMMSGKQITDPSAFSWSLCSPFPPPVLQVLFSGEWFSLWWCYLWACCHFGNGRPARNGSSSSKKNVSFKTVVQNMLLNLPTWELQHPKMLQRTGGEMILPNAWWRQVS